MRDISHAAIFSVICISLAACVTSSEPTGSAREGYLQYVKDNHFKAFAATENPLGGGGVGWGYASNRPTAKEAVTEARYKCKQAQARYMALCRHQ